MKRAIAFALLALVALGLVGVAFQLAVCTFAYDRMITFCVATLGLDPALAHGLAWLAVALVTLIPLRVLVHPSRLLQFCFFSAVGVLGISGWAMNRNNLFSPGGRPLVYVAVTPSGLVVSYRPGVVGGTGTPLKAVTPQTAVLVQLWKKYKGVPPLQLEPCAIAFNPADGSPLCWWEKARGRFLFAPFPGYSPQDGQLLRPVSHSVIAAWEEADERGEMIEKIEASPIFNSLHVFLAAAPVTSGIRAEFDPLDGANKLPVGTGIPVHIAFTPLPPAQVGMDRLTAISLAVRSALGAFPGQTINFRVAEEINSAEGTPVIPPGSTAEGYVGVDINAADANQIAVSVETVRLFRPGRRHPMHLVAHLAKCALPLMNLQVCELILDEPFPDTPPRLGTNSLAISKPSGSDPGSPAR